MGKESDTWHGLYHATERQYQALIKLLRSQIGAVLIIMMWTERAK